MKRKRGIINDEGEIKDIEQENDDGYEIPGDIGDFPIVKFILAFLVILAGIILGAFIIGDATSDKSPDYSNMLAGCVGLVSANSPDGTSSGNWPSPFYYGATISKVVSNCMQKTELQPYNKVTNITLSWGAVEASAAGCSGSEVDKSQIDSPSSRKNFADCMTNANIGWRQIGEATAEPTLEIKS